MISPNRNLFVLFRSVIKDKKVIEREVDCLSNVLQKIGSPENFCKAHELVDRNRITSRRNKILKEANQVILRPFRFLINKN